MSSDQFLLHQRIKDLISEEDRLLEETLAEQRRSDSDWSDKLEMIMSNCIMTKKNYENQVAAFRSIAESHEELLSKVAEEVKGLMKDFPTEFEHHAHGASDEEAEMVEQEALEMVAGGFSSSAGLDTAIQMDYFDKVRAASTLGRIVCSRPFDTICTIVILVNSVFIGISVEYDLNHVKEDKTDWQRGFDIFFYCFYLVELILKLNVHRRNFLVPLNPDWLWNIFDLILVLTATYDMINEYAVDSDGGGANVMWMRLLRIVKMMKLMRMVRVMRFFRELRLMMDLIAKSFRSLFWAMVMLGLTMYLFALCILSGVTGYLGDKLLDKDNPIDPQVKLAIEKYWDSVYDAICTLLMSITRGVDWHLVLKPLEEVGQIYHILFLFYISFVTFAVLNIMTGIFVDASFESSAKDGQNVAREALNLTAAQGNKLTNLLSNWCTVPKMLALDELKLCCQEDAEIQAILSEMEIDELDIEDMFNSTKKNDGVVSEIEAAELFHHKDKAMISVDDIAKGIMCMKGPAQALDVVQLAFSVGKYAEAMEHFMHYVDDQLLCMRRALQLKLRHHANYVIPLKVRLQAARRMPVKMFS